MLSVPNALPLLILQLFFLFLFRLFRSPRPFFVKAACASPLSRYAKASEASSTSGDSDDDASVYLAGMFLKYKRPKRIVDPARTCVRTEEGVTLETPGVQEERQVDTTASNGWSHLCIGPQFCGEEFNFVNWDSITTV
jgi:hypothetical protein